VEGGLCLEGLVTGIFKGDILSLDPCCISLLPGCHEIKFCSATPFCHDALPHHRLRNNRSK
jgi:hypothetical protein